MELQAFKHLNDPKPKQSLGSKLKRTLINPWIKYPLIAATAGVVTLGALIAGHSNYATNRFAEVLAKSDEKRTEDVHILDRNGRIIAEVNGEKYYRLEDFSDEFKTTLVGLEDQNFYDHEGIDYLALARVIKSGFSHGGSTIDMQTVGLIMNHSSTDPFYQKVWDKIRELGGVIGINNNYTKEQILEVYANSIQANNYISSYGLLAEEIYGKTPDKLSTKESIALVELMQAPGAHSPKHKETRARLEDQCKISYDRLRRQGHSLKFKNENYSQGMNRNFAADANLDSHYPYVIEFVRNQVQAWAADQGLNPSEYNILSSNAPIRNNEVTIKTTLDNKTLWYLKQAVEGADRDHGEVSYAITDPQNGEIRAIYFMKEQADPRANKHMHFGNYLLTGSSIMFGSSDIKPEIYALLFESGMYAPYDSVDDKSLAFSVGATDDEDFDGVLYPGGENVHNINRKFWNLPLIEQLKESNNIIATAGYKKLGEHGDFYTDKLHHMLEGTGSKEYNEDAYIALGQTHRSVIGSALAASTYVDGGYIEADPEDPALVIKSINFGDGRAIRTIPTTEKHYILGEKGVSFIQQATNMKLNHKNKSIGRGVYAGMKSGTAPPHNTAKFFIQQPDGTYLVGAGFRYADKYGNNGTRAHIGVVTRLANRFGRTDENIAFYDQNDVSGKFVDDTYIAIGDTDDDVISNPDTLSGGFSPIVREDEATVNPFAGDIFYNRRLKGTRVVLMHDSKRQAIDATLKKGLLNGDISRQVYRTLSDNLYTGIPRVDKKKRFDLYDLDLTVRSLPTNGDLGNLRRSLEYEIDKFQL